MKGARKPKPPAPDYVVHACEQDTEEWHLLKLGVPSTSSFAAVLAGGRGGEESKTRKLYMRKLAGEVVSGIPREDYANFAMKRGAEMEPHLRSLYTLHTGRPVLRLADAPGTTVAYEPGEPPHGFATRRLKDGVVVGSSPDGMVGADGGVEFKSAAPHVLMELFEAGRFPPEHVAQCQGHMLVHGRQWWDIAIGYTGCPLFVRRLRRDPSYIARLEIALAAFCGELSEMVAWFRRQR